LIFVDHAVLKSSAVLFGEGRELVKQLDGLDQQVVEIERIRFAKTLFIFVEHVGRVFP
jgi:hypothetical protein